MGPGQGHPARAYGDGQEVEIGTEKRVRLRKVMMAADSPGATLHACYSIYRGYTGGVTTVSCNCRSYLFSYRGYTGVASNIKRYVSTCSMRYSYHPK